MTPLSKIDISENTLRNRGQVLDILLVDRTKQKPRSIFNIIWATDSYAKHTSTNQIKRVHITGANGKIIKPRAAKSKDEQKYRTRVKAEVFTSLKVVKQMNIAIDRASVNWPVNKQNWINYISENRLEISCGEAPFIVSRYDPTIDTGIIVPLNRRVGFLDRKLQVVGKYVNTKHEWLKYAELALKATYGYEWQGDNLLIARENILFTLDDFYKDFCIKKLGLKSKQNLTDKQLEFFAEIISWNIFQMDGLKFVVPMSCKNETKIIEGKINFFDGQEPDIVEKYECEGCKHNKPNKHNGKYAKIMDWEKNKPIRFVDLLNTENK